MNKLTIAFLAAVSIVSFGCKKGGSGALGKMGDFKDQMCKCKDKACADKVNDDMTKAMSDMAKDSKEAKPSEDDVKKGADMMKDYTECQAKAAGGDKKMEDKKDDKAMGGDDKKMDDKKMDDKKMDDKAMASGDGDMPKECAEWAKAMEDLGKCDKYKDALPAMKTAMDGMKAGFAAYASLPADQKKTAMDAAGASCKTSMDGMAQAAKAMGCP